MSNASTGRRGVRARRRRQRRHRVAMVRLGLKRMVAAADLVLQIRPGWQSNRDALAETIRRCQHEGQRGLNADGVPFCLECGRHLSP